MKLHALYFFGLILSLFLASCSSDDDGGGDSIEGTYNITEITTTGCDDPIFNESFVLDNDGCFTQDGEQICLTKRSMTFNNGQFSLNYSFSDGTFSIDLSETGTYTVSGNQVTVCIDGECDTTPFDVNNGTITFRSVDPDDNCVLTLKAKKV